LIEFELVVTIERYPLDEALRYALLAEKWGFDAIGVPDHFHPWSHKYGQSGFCWVWMGVAASKTKRIQVGSCVTAPIIRYHPAIVAQAFATLGYLFPGRIYLGVGTGEAMNELPLGFEWPPAPTRIEMLDEALTIIRLLWSRSRVTFNGKYWRLSKATVYTKPRGKVPIFVAGTGVKVARVAGRHCDAFITVPHLKVPLERVLGSLRRGAREAGRDPDSIKLVLHTMVSYDEDYDRALDATECWGAALLPAMYRYGVYDPLEMDEHAELVGREARAKKFIIVTDPDELISRVEGFIQQGFTRFQFNNSSPEPEKLIEVVGKRVIPYLKELYAE